MCGGTPDDAIEYAKSGYLNFMHNAKILGGGITKRVDDGVSYFLWRNMPDDELFDLAGTGRLSESAG